HNVEKTTHALKEVRPLVFLGLGANVALVANDGEETEGKIANLNYAITELCSLPDSQIIDISSFYESEPAYKQDQDMFVNAVVAMRTGISPKELLSYLHAIENSLGRVRSEANGPRTCDIDILDYQLYTSSDAELMLPHPLMLERDFVMQPFMEIRPGYILANGDVVSYDSVRVGRARKIEV
ncbi:MAG: 2-amino-4-hydroxy-6-hydroxymethyldihydropteridine diphosphokinase, partial [Eggerthellaceae bacterium]|nr:2-amino-4-hydroxy-6-hydroxymethyldihydropteridine diphosphokinase [Eggerthellaceae bacterium]